MSCRFQKFFTEFDLFSSLKRLFYKKRETNDNFFALYTDPLNCRRTNYERSIPPFLLRAFHPQNSSYEHSTQKLLRTSIPPFPLRAFHPQSSPCKHSTCKVVRVFHAKATKQNDMITLKSPCNFNTFLPISDSLV